MIAILRVYRITVAPPFEQNMFSQHLEENCDYGKHHFANNEMFKLALANASRHVLLRSKVLEEVVCFYNVFVTNVHNHLKYFTLPVNE